MGKAFSVLLLSLTLSACASSGDSDYAVAGPVPPPAKPYYEPQVYLPVVNLDSDFLSAAGTNTVFFDTNQSTLTPQARDVLTRQLAWLMTHRDVSFSVEGHCDERASSAYNQALGRRRSEAVKQFFVEHGIREVRITATTFGKESPVYDKYGDIQINRRVVTVLSSS